MNATLPVGQLLRAWRQRRRMSQLDFACEAEISSKHLSFLETGRSMPSREMVLKLAELLEVPLRERNEMLIAAGFAPVFSRRALTDPEMQVAREAVEKVLKGHEPYPAIAIDRYWTLVAANSAIQPMLAGVDPKLLQPPLNVLRLSLHPDGLAPRIVNLPQWREHLLARLHREIEISADSNLSALAEELVAYPMPVAAVSETKTEPPSLVVPFQLAINGQVLNFISTTTIFGTPIDVTLSELAIESFFPADSATATLLQHLGGATTAQGA
jgi:transcriptional regulator with XRE-family HTH domain